MPRLIDDEAEGAALVFLGRNQEPAFLRARAAAAAARRDNFDEPLLVGGRDGRDHNPVVGVRDLMLSARIPTPTDDERRHLVVELKRPLQPLNEDVLGQIRKYAKAVALDVRFKHSNVEWDFVAISNKFTPDAELEARMAGKPRGLIMELDDPIRIRVWAKTWGQIIQEAEGRLTFYKRRLEYQASDEEALAYLRAIDAAYLSEAVKARIAELDGGEAADEPKAIG